MMTMIENAQDCTFCITFMHLADTFIQSNLQYIQVIHLLSVSVFLGIEPTTFALLTQCSTTEPQELYDIYLFQKYK